VVAATGVCTSSALLTVSFIEVRHCIVTGLPLDLMFGGFRRCASKLVKPNIEPHNPETRSCNSLLHNCGRPSMTASGRLLN
jgi:hypothetical protein